MTPTTQAATQISTTAAPLFFQSISFVLGVLGFSAGMIKGVFWLLDQKKRNKTEWHNAFLSIKQASLSMFMQVVIGESVKLVQLVDDHLPLALTQSTKSIPSKSRFDFLCESLRNLREDELSDDKQDGRARYLNIIKEVFAGVIIDNVMKLVAAASPTEKTISTDLLNPTGLRFSLTHETELKFTFVSAKIEEARRKERRIHWWWKVTLVLWVIAIIAGATFWIPALLLSDEWCSRISVSVLLLITVTGLGGLLSAVFLINCETWLIRTAEVFQDDSGAAKQFESWKARVS